MDDKNVGYQLEYNAIRQEMMSSTRMKDQMLIAMLTVSVLFMGAAFGFGLKMLFVFMQVLLILIQVFINSKTLISIRNSVYISVFIEDNMENMQWERIVHECDAEYHDRYRMKMGKIEMEKVVLRYSGTIVSGIAFISYVGKSFIIQNGLLTVSLWDIFMLIVSFALCFIIYKQNKTNMDYDKTCGRYEEILKELKTKGEDRNNP